MQNRIRATLLALGVTASLYLPTLAHADTSLLSPAYAAQLGTWLGKGSVTYQQIFTKTAGATSQDFHAAVDNKGGTVTLLEATSDDGRTWLIGGYNPQSWNSSGTFNIVADESQRVSFLFNLTDGLKYLQTPNYGGPEDFGAYQAYNDVGFGPTFGYSDLMVASDLSSGGSGLLSYCDLNCPVANMSLLNGSMANNLTIGRMEVYSLSAVPEPESAAMLLAGLGLLALRRRRIALR